MDYEELPSLPPLQPCTRPVPGLLGEGLDFTWRTPGCAGGWVVMPASGHFAPNWSVAATVVPAPLPPPS